MSMLLSHISSRSATSKLKVVYNFPVRGHSYLPADRVFGRLEQDIRRAGQILLPSEYIDIMKKHGSVYEYGTDWQGLDVKKEVKRITKSNKSFKISEARVIELSEGKLTMQQAYSGPSTTHTVLKRGMTWRSFSPEPLPLKSHVKEAKKTDVRKLLEDLGASEEIKTVYETMLSAPSNGNDSESD